MFEPRDVLVGERVEGKLQILSGLKAGDKVAVSGGYLIDSESQLQAGTGDQGPGKAGTGDRGPGKTGTGDRGPGTAKGGHEGHTPAVAPPKSPAKKGTLQMDDMKM